MVSPDWTPLLDSGYTGSASSARRQLPKLGNLFPPNSATWLARNMNSDDEWLAASFSELFPAHVSSFVELMIVLRREFDGDLDMMLVLAVIGDRRFSRRDPNAIIAYERLGATPMLEIGRASINAHSIAEYTGIPRETVRRKVAALMERGWVERDNQSDLRPTPKAASDLKPATDATLAYLRTILAARGDNR